MRTQDQSLIPDYPKLLTPFLSTTFALYLNRARLVIAHSSLITPSEDVSHMQNGTPFPSFVSDLLYNVSDVDDAEEDDSGCDVEVLEPNNQVLCDFSQGFAHLDPASQDQPQTDTFPDMSAPIQTSTPPTAQEPADQEQQPNRQEKIIFSIFRVASSFNHTRDTAPYGIAYFSDNKIFLGDTDTFEAVIHQLDHVQPSFIITTALFKPDLEQLFASAQSSNLQIQLSSPSVFALNPSEFDYNQCFLKFMSLNINSLASDTSSSTSLQTISTRNDGIAPPPHFDTLHALKWSSVVDLSKIHVVSALSGLLSYIIQRYSSIISTSTPISIHPIITSEIVSCDQATRDIFPIFIKDHSVHDRVKEGSSIFSIMDQTKTKAGSILLRSWMLYPSTNIPVLNERLNHIDFLLNPDTALDRQLRRPQLEQTPLYLQLRDRLIGVCDIRLCLRRIANMTATYKDIIRVSSGLEAYLALANTLSLYTPYPTPMSIPSKSTFATHPMPTIGGMHDFEAQFSPQPQPHHPQSWSSLAPTRSSLPTTFESIINPESVQFCQHLYTVLSSLVQLDESSKQQRLVLDASNDPVLAQLNQNLAGLDLLLDQTLRFDVNSGIISNQLISSILFHLPPGSQRDIYKHLRYVYIPFRGFFLSIQLPPSASHPAHPTHPPPHSGHHFNTIDSTAQSNNVEIGIPNHDIASQPTISSKTPIACPEQLYNTAVQCGMVFAFSPVNYSNQYLFITQRTDQLVVDVGDIQADINQYTHSVFLDLLDYIQQNATYIEHYTTLLAETDVYCALALTANELELCRPEISPECTLQIDHGRHLLLDILLSDPSSSSSTLDSSESESGCIPNSIHIGPDHSKIHIITGPNKSGKSTILHTFGIITFLAHIGSYVPASRAVVGICDRIVARHHIKDSVSNSTSTFSADIAALSHIINNASKYSLILIDEMCVGTSVNDSIGLFAGIVEYFKDQRASCPKILITTHFIELFSYHILHEDLFMRVYTMNTVYNRQFYYAKQRQQEQHHPPASTVAVDVATLRYAYRLTPGWSLGSEEPAQASLICAQDAGVVAAVLTRGQELLTTSLVNSTRINSTANTKLTITPVSLIYFLYGPTVFRDLVRSYLTSLESVLPNAITQSSSHKSPLSLPICHLELSACLPILQQFFSFLATLRNSELTVPTFAQITNTSLTNSWIRSQRLLIASISLYLLPPSSLPMLEDDTTSMLD